MRSLTKKLMKIVEMIAKKAVILMIRTNKQEKTMKRAIVMTIMVLALMCGPGASMPPGASGGGGCVTTRAPMSYTCDWCGQLFYVASNPGVEEWAYTPQGPIRAKTNLIKDEQGHNFCCLKCQNAYLASKDIKEQRSRTITGE